MHLKFKPKQVLSKEELCEKSLESHFASHFKISDSVQMLYHKFFWNILLCFSNTIRIHQQKLNLKFTGPACQGIIQYNHLGIGGVGQWQTQALDTHPPQKTTDEQKKPKISPNHLIRTGQRSIAQWQCLPCRQEVLSLIPSTDTKNMYVLKNRKQSDCHMCTFLKMTCVWTVEGGEKKKRMCNILHINRISTQKTRGQLPTRHQAVSTQKKLNN